MKETVKLFSRIKLVTIAVSSFTTTILGNLTSVGAVGPNAPMYARGTAIGVADWLSKVVVSTVDAGTTGSGKGVPIPLVAPPPLIYANLLTGMSSNDLLGILAPTLCLGLSNGLSAVFLQTLTNTTHPSVGSGAGVARFRGPPATPLILRGYVSSGMSGSGLPKKARAVGTALDVTLSSLVLPLGIVGPSSTSASSGVGSGKLV